MCSSALIASVVNVKVLLILLIFIDASLWVELKLKYQNFVKETSKITEKTKHSVDCENEFIEKNGFTFYADSF